MAQWQAKRFRLPNHNFETTAIKFEDGRVGLCYHGSVIWDDEGGGWEEFIASDWATVWKEGTPCSFNELPLEMRIACPACGGKVSPTDKACSKCGVIFEKIKTEPVKPEPAVDSQRDAGVKSRSRVLDVSLAVAALLIAGLFVFYALKPGPPQTLAPSTPPAEDQSVSERSEPPAARPDTSRERLPAEREEAVTESRSEPPADEPDTSPEPVPEEQFYSHINLDDPETARSQIEEETKKINEEAAQIKQEMAAAGTPEEKQRVGELKNRYDQKALQLMELIREFNDRNK